MTDQKPLLPAEPWYTSEVQVRAVIAMGAQLFSIGARIVGRFLPVDVSGADIDAIVADVSQGVAIWFGALAIIKRQTSAIAPLTLTAGGAAVQSMTNPSMLDADPTKATKVTP